MEARGPWTQDRPAPGHGLIPDSEYPQPSNPMSLSRPCAEHKEEREMRAPLEGLALGQYGQPPGRGETQAAGV